MEIKLRHILFLEESKKNGSVEFEEFTFFLKTLPNIKPNLKCIVLYVNMFLGSLVDEILNVDMLCWDSCYKILLLCSYIFIMSGYLSSSLYLCLGLCSGLYSLIAGFWASPNHSTECHWVNYGTILKWLKITDFVYVVGTWMPQFAAQNQHSVIYYVQRLRSNVVNI